MSNTQLSAITFLYNLMANDNEIKSLMGTPARLYPTWAVKDAVFPYAVYRLINGANPSRALYNGTFYVDIWTYSNQLETLYEIRNRIITLLDDRKFQADDPVSGAKDVVAFRTYLNADRPIPEDTEYVIHQSMEFNVRYDRFREIVNILNR